jgi:hypothetical protein
MLAIWYWSKSSAPDWKTLGWPAIFRSLYGYVWLGFGTHFVVRFLLLAFDSYVFGDMSSRLADVPADKVSMALIMAVAYLIALVIAYRAARDHIASFFRLPISIPGEQSRTAQVLISAGATVGIAMSSGYVPIPLALFTPFGILGSLWIIPATCVWWDRFKYGRSASSHLLWIFLLPGFARAVLSPYRENLLAPVLAMIMAWTFAGRRVRPIAVVAGLLALYLASTTVVSAYREVLWEDVPASVAMEGALTGHTLAFSPDAKWVESLRRFHAFDSLLLTVSYVPDLIPYSNRTVVWDALVRGVIPRAFYEAKEGSNRGQVFGTTIWNYEDPTNESGAAIAPSMPGDLFEAGGAFMVIIGGFLWGLMLGLLEAWKRGVSTKAAAALTAMFMFHCFASVERDYAHIMSTTIQYLIVMFLVAKIVTSKRSAGFRADPQTDG